MTTRPGGSNATPPRWNRVLVFHIGSFGDTVLSVPALQALRDHVGPSASVTLLHDDGAGGRVSPTDIIPDGLIDEVLRFAGPVRDARHRGIGAARRAIGFATLLRDLRARHFDAVVNLALTDRPDRTKQRDRAYFRLAGIATFVGFEPEVPGSPEADARLGRLRRAGIAADLGDGPWLVPAEPARLEAERWLAGADLIGGRPLVTVAPATLMEAKRWPTERWALLGARLRDDLRLEPIVIGGPADRPEGDDLVAAWGGGANAAGALTPAGSAALMQMAALHIGVDTGTTHVAAASGIPVVALYSHRAPIEQWAPMGSGHRIVDHPVPCAGCLAVVCPVAGRPCMTGITIDEVWTQVVATAESVVTRG